MSVVDKLVAIIAELEELKAELEAMGTKGARKKRQSATDDTAAEGRRSIWDAYEQAFVRRYGFKPVRNATVNAQIASLQKRLGTEEAVAVASYYLTIVSHQYRGHPVSLLLRDCEMLSTLRRTGRKQRFGRGDLVSQMIGHGGITIDAGEARAAGE